MHVTQSGWTGKKGGRVRDDVQEVQPFKVTKKCARYHFSTDYITSNTTLNIIGP